MKRPGRHLPGATAGRSIGPPRLGTRVRGKGHGRRRRVPRERAGPGSSPGSPTPHRPGPAGTGPPISPRSTPVARSAVPAGRGCRCAPGYPGRRAAREARRTGGERSSLGRGRRPSAARLLAARTGVERSARRGGRSRNRPSATASILCPSTAGMGGKTGHGSCPRIEKSGDFAARPPGLLYRPVHPREVRIVPSLPIEPAEAPSKAHRPADVPEGSLPVQSLTQRLTTARPRPWPDHPVPIALVITDLDVGGAERAMVNLAIRLDRRRWSPMVIALGARGPWQSVVRRAGLPCQCLGVDRHRPVRAVVRLARASRAPAGARAEFPVPCQRGGAAGGPMEMPSVGCRRASRRRASEAMAPRPRSADRAPGQRLGLCLSGRTGIQQGCRGAGSPRG